MCTDIDMTKRHTPASVSNDNLTFSIPLYQRLFTWRDVQVVGMMHDLQQHFSQYPYKPYFIGMLSCVKNPRSGRFDLIDGQQRFTVIMLMGLVLRKYDERWNSFIDNSNRLYFTARERDNACIHALTIETQSDLKPENRMYEAIMAIQKFLDDKAVFSTLEEQRRFAGFVFEKMSFFLSVLPDSYASNPSSLNEYFEAMNAGGKGLEQHEVLKVQLLRGENEQEELTRIWNAVCDMDRPVIRKGEDVNENKYRDSYLEAIRLCRMGNCSKALASIFPDGASDMTSIGDIQPFPVTSWKDSLGTDEANYRCIITFPQFLMIVFDIYHNLNGGYSYYRQALLSTFGDERYKIKDKHGFYKLLLLCRLLFDYYVIHREGIDYSEGYDLMARSDNPRDFYSRALIQYQSMLYVSQVPLYNWLKPMLKTLLDKDEQTSCEELLGILKSLGNGQAFHTPPNSITDLSYRKGIDRYWFWKLDYLLWERHENGKECNDELFTKCSKVDHLAISSYVFRRDRSIEHLHPQNPLPESETQDWKEDRQTHNDEIRDGFGNLAMISPSFNSTQGRDSISTKIARIEDQVRERRLQSIKLLLMARVAESEGWTVDAAKAHGAKMLTVLQKR